MIKYYFGICIILSTFSFSAIQAQKFEDHFENKTLRLDYIFTGTNDSQDIALDEISQLPEWNGRIHNLDSLLLMGNGQIIVTDDISGICIYKDAFSTLFQEWQTMPEARIVKQSFENTYLVPYPKRKVNIEIKLRDREGKYHTKIRHMIDPSDILIKKKGIKNIPSYTYTHRAVNNPSRTINVAILAEGYTEEEMPKFHKHAQIATDRILAHAPFDRNRSKFSFIAVETPSINSGVSIPRKNIWQETAFNSHFDTFYSERYLTTKSIKKVHDVIAGIPYSHIIILANTDVYGGGGIFNAYTLTTTGHHQFGPVVVHEFGHSFAGLADEYFYEGDIGEGTYKPDVEPWEQNITTLVNFSSKWESILAKDTPIPTPPTEKERFPAGVYEGAGYSAKEIYRPAYDCRMRTNTSLDFCLVCQKAIENLIKFYTE